MIFHVEYGNVSAEVQIAPLRNYDARVSGRPGNEGANPTAQLMIRSADLKGAELNTFADDLCRALSILQGRSISWIFWVTSERGRAFESALFGGQVTKWGRAPALCFHPKRPPFLLDLEPVASVVGAVMEFRKGFDKNHTLIKMWLDSRTEGDFLEGRTLKCVVVLEMLKNITDAVKGRNTRAKFKEKLILAAQDHGIQFDKDDLECFVKIRNGVVHTGGYDTNVLLPDEWQFPDRPVWAFHFFVADFVDRAILQLFGLGPHLPSRSVRTELHQSSEG